MAKKEYVKVMTPAFRISFPNISEAKAINGQGDPKFGMKMLFPKDVNQVPQEFRADYNEKLANMRTVCKNVAMKFWENKLPANLKKPFHDGDTESEYPEDSGHWYASARTTKKPGVVDGRNHEYKEKNAIDDLIYGGCWCRATVAIGATETGGSKCVHFVLNNIQKLKDDSPFGNRKAATEEFEQVDFSEVQDDFEDEGF